jgi:hypothetical protein
MLLGRMNFLNGIVAARGTRRCGDGEELTGGWVKGIWQKIDRNTAGSGGNEGKSCRPSPTIVAPAFRLMSAFPLGLL